MRYHEFCTRKFTTQDCNPTSEHIAITVIIKSCVSSSITITSTKRWPVVQDIATYRNIRVRFRGNDCPL